MHNLFSTAIQERIKVTAKVKQIIVSLRVDETSEWCNSFVVVLKPKGKVRICLDPTKTKPGINHTRKRRTENQLPSTLTCTRKIPYTHRHELKISQFKV